MSDFKFSIIQEYAPFFLSGTWLTIKLSVIAILWISAGARAGTFADF